MRRFEELPAIHKHLIGMAIVLLSSIMFLVIQPSISFELIVILGAAGVAWLLLSLAAWAIRARKRTDSVEDRMKDLYDRLQKVHEKAKAVGDPRLAEYDKTQLKEKIMREQKRLQELTLAHLLCETPEFKFLFKFLLAYTTFLSIIGFAAGKEPILWNVENILGKIAGVLVLIGVCAIIALFSVSQMKKYK